MPKKVTLVSICKKSFKREMKAKRLETICDKNMGLNPAMYQIIVSSPYFKSLFSMKTFHEVQIEIVKKVVSLEPVTKANGPSLAFCLLYKLFTLKLTIKQVYGLLNNSESMYCRGLAVIFLRLVCKPADLWDWYKNYFGDRTELTLVGGPQSLKMTIGKMCRELLLEQRWFTLFLPRIPVPLHREIQEKLREIDSAAVKPVAADLINDTRDDTNNHRLEDKQFAHEDMHKMHDFEGSSLPSRLHPTDRKRSRSPTREYKSRSRSPDRIHRSRSPRRRQHSRSPRRNHSSRSPRRNHRSRSRDRFNHSALDRKNYHHKHSDRRSRERSREIRYSSTDKSKDRAYHNHRNVT